MFWTILFAQNFQAEICWRAKSAYVIKTIFRDPETGFPFHPAAFASYQNSLKIKKKKVRSRLGPDGVPCKRKSREGTTTYLWEFLLKLLQVRKNKPESHTQNAKPDVSKCSFTVTFPSPPGSRVLPQVHQVEQQGEGSVQAGGQQGCVQAVGDAQEQARHELRDDGQGAQVGTR